MAALLIPETDTVALQADLIRPRIPQTLLDIASFNDLAAGATAAPVIAALRANHFPTNPEPTGFTVFPGLSRLDELPLAEPGTTLPLVDLDIVSHQMREMRESNAQLAAVTRTWQSLLRLQASTTAPTFATPAPFRAHSRQPKPAQATQQAYVPASRAYAQFLELAQWLERSRAETADLLGIGRTTPSAWERDGREPQARHARRLYQTHALVSALVSRQGLEDTRRWLRSNSPSPLNLIGEGRVDLAEDRAHDLIYGRVARATGPIDRLQPSDPSDVPLVNTDPPTRQRRARSSRRTST
jgi:transcriptional regulator with XRE-family HTH domain